MPAPKRKPHNLHYLHRDRGYRFIDRDSDMEELCSIIHESELSTGDIIEKVLDASNNTVRLGHSTIENWLSGKTRRPQNFTLHWVGYALGYERRWKRT